MEQASKLGGYMIIKLTWLIFISTMNIYIHVRSSNHEETSILVSKNLHMGFKIVILVKYWYFAHMWRWKILFCQVITLIMIILSHTNTRAILLRYEGFCTIIYPNGIRTTNNIITMLRKFSQIEGARKKKRMYKDNEGDNVGYRLRWNGLIN